TLMTGPIAPLTAGFRSSSRPCPARRLPIELTSVQVSGALDACQEHRPTSWRDTSCRERACFAEVRTEVGSGNCNRTPADFAARQSPVPLDRILEPQPLHLRV